MTKFYNSKCGITDGCDNEDCQTCDGKLEYIPGDPCGSLRVTMFVNHHNCIQENWYLLNRKNGEAWRSAWSWHNEPSHYNLFENATKSIEHFRLSANHWRLYHSPLYYESVEDMMAHATLLGSATTPIDPIDCCDPETDCNEVCPDLGLPLANQTTMLGIPYCAYHDADFFNDLNRCVYDVGDHVGNGEQTASADVMACWQPDGAFEMPWVHPDFDRIKVWYKYRTWRWGWGGGCLFEMFGRNEWELRASFQDSNPVVYIDEGFPVCNHPSVADKYCFSSGRFCNSDFVECDGSIRLHCEMPDISDVVWM